MTEEQYFPQNYESSRLSFRSAIESIREKWPDAQLKKYMVDTADDLSIDWIEAFPPNGDLLLVITTGEHGIEGYIGSAVLQMLIHDYLPKMDAKATGLALVHTINPWGMKYNRRTNKANVDLNRNFVSDPLALDRAVNLDYAKLNRFLNPKGKILNIGMDRFMFLPKLLFNGLMGGFTQFKKATLAGQYANPQGIYYGGRGVQPETRQLMGLYAQWYGRYKKIVHIDLHSGYGPRYRMSMVNSVYEEKSSTDYQILFDYPLVVKTSHEEFYQINGDMIDYVYQFMARDWPQKKFFATCFEFGTLGDKTAANIKGLQTLISENQAFHYGTLKQKDMDKIKTDFMEMFFPSEEAWRKIALDNARQAFNGIFKTWGIIGS